MTSRTFGDLPKVSQHVGLLRDGNLGAFGCGLSRLFSVINHHARGYWRESRAVTDPLYGVRLKLAHASHHLGVLHNCLGWYVERAPYVPMLDDETEPGTWIVRAHLREGPPERLALIAGDVLHNLRSGLDHLAWQLVLRANGEPGTHTQFPIFLSENPSRFKHMVRGMDAAMVARIQELQPYTRGEQRSRDLLGVLAQLSNQDKHNILVVTTVWFSGEMPKHVFGRATACALTIRSRDPKPEGFFHQFEQQRILPGAFKPGAELHRLKAPDGIAVGEVDMEFLHALPQVRVQVPGTEYRLALRETMEGLLEAVGGVVTTFADAFFS